MKNNKLTPKEGQQLTLDLIDFVTENPNELDWLCDEHVISGEKVWTMIGALADVKLQEFPYDEED